MPLPRFRALSNAEARVQRRMQVNASIAARSVNMEGKDFAKHIKALSDG